MERTFIAKFSDIPDYGWWMRPERADVMTDADVILMLLGMSFTDPAARDQFIKLSAVHADYCLNAEPDTLVYSGGLSRTDATFGISQEADLIFVMACTDMAAVEKHRDDPNHLALAPVFAEAGVTPKLAFTRVIERPATAFYGTLPGHPDCVFTMPVEQRRTGHSNVASSEADAVRSLVQTVKSPGYFWYKSQRRFPS